MYSLDHWPIRSENKRSVRRLHIRHFLVLMPQERSSTCPSESCLRCFLLQDLSSVYGGADESLYICRYALITCRGWSRRQRTETARRSTMRSLHSRGDHQPTSQSPCAVCHEISPDLCHCMSAMIRLAATRIRRRQFAHGGPGISPLLLVQAGEPQERKLDVRTLSDGDLVSCSAPGHAAATEARAQVRAWSESPEFASLRSERVTPYTAFRGSALHKPFGCLRRVQRRCTWWECHEGDRDRSVSPRNRRHLAGSVSVGGFKR